MAGEHPFRLIIFDVDGTLVDTQHHITAAMGESFLAAGLPAPKVEEVRRTVGLHLEEAFLRLAPPELPRGTLEEMMGRFKKSAMAQRRQPGYREPLYDEVRETIALLDLPHVCLGIATGRVRRGIDFSLQLHGLERHFVTIQTVDNNPGKPHPGMVLRAMAEAGAGPEETVVIGDTSYDMIMAKEAGAAAVGVTWGYHAGDELLAAGAEALVGKMAELPKTLEAFRRERSCA
jgi:phosphoglycolate phosphatase